MKKLSIKKKIIILYTFLIALLIGIDFYILDTTASKILIDQAERGVITATDEIAALIKMEDDGPYLESGDDEGAFHFYHDGVIFLIYSGQNISYGSTPTNFDSTLSISLGEIQIQEHNGMTWVVYDVSMSGGYVLRGIYDIQVMADSLNRIILFAGISSLVVILLTAIGGFLIIERAFRPIKKIYKTAAAIEQKEDYSKRIETNFAKDEIYELAEMVNQMLDKVEKSISREKQFSSNVSHELRTPLTVMQAQAEYLLEKAENITVKEEIKSIIAQVSFMENIVTQLLEITRSRQIADSEMDILNLSEIVEYTAESYSGMVEEKKIKINVEKPKFSTNTVGNQTLLIRVFSNLITNAIKYNKVDGTINISFSEELDNILVNIKDTGIGIPKAKIDMIFNPFYRADESRTPNDYSLGLGLALAKEVVKIHGGDITVTSEESVGTTFVVSLLKVK